MKTTCFAFTIIFFLASISPIASLRGEDAGSTEKEIPLAELFSEKNLDEYRKKNQYVHKPEKIEPKKEVHKSGMLRPEEQGESYSDYKADMLFKKLGSGDKIEQRKAANEIWLRYGEKKEQLTEEEQELINKSVQRYLEMNTPKMNSEASGQIRRLWHLSVPVLLRNVTNPDKKISNISSYMLSRMKNEAIVDQLLSMRKNVKEDSDIARIDFALRYMEINNREQYKRPQITKEESQKIYDEKIAPILGSGSTPAKNTGKTPAKY